MKVKDIIEALQKCNPELNITVFDEHNIPHKVVKVFIDDRNEDNAFSYIEVECSKE